MALDIKVQDHVDRPLVGGGKADTETIDEVRPLVKEAQKLPDNKALPLVVPANQAQSLINALRAVGEELNLTIRFKRFPKIGEDGQQLTREAKRKDKDGNETTVTVKEYDSFEFTNKTKRDARVTFWTTKKVIRKRNTGNADQPTGDQPTADQPTAD